MHPDGWVDAHGDILFRYALARMGDAGVAEDLVQETFLAALQAQASFRGDSAERTWLVGILRNKLIDRLRRTCRDLPLAGDEEGDAVVDHLYDAFGGWRDAPKSWANDPGELSDRREFWEVFAHPPHPGRRRSGDVVPGFRTDGKQLLGPAAPGAHPPAPLP
jgi:RNA polymerase sigma-70 factor (ECF subfamily)